MGLALLTNCRDPVVYSSDTPDLFARRFICNIYSDTHSRYIHKRSRLKLIVVSSASFHVDGARALKRLPDCPVDQPICPTADNHVTPESRVQVHIIVRIVDSPWNQVMFTWGRWNCKYWKMQVRNKQVRVNRASFIALKATYSVLYRLVGRL